MSPQLPRAAGQEGSGGRRGREGTAGGGLTAPKAVVGLSGPQSSGDPAEGSVPVKRDMAARPTGPGGLSRYRAGAGLKLPGRPLDLFRLGGAETTFPRRPRAALAGRGRGRGNGSASEPVRRRESSLAT